MSSKKSLSTKPIRPPQPSSSAKENFIFQPPALPAPPASAVASEAVPPKEEAGKEGGKRVTVYLSEEEMRALKIWCAQHDQKLTQLFRELVLEHIGYSSKP